MGAWHSSQTLRSNWQKACYKGQDPIPIVEVTRCASLTGLETASVLLMSSELKMRIDTELALMEHSRIFVKPQYHSGLLEVQIFL